MGFRSYIPAAACVFLVSFYGSALAEPNETRNVHCGPSRDKQETVSELIQRTDHIILGQVTDVRPIQNGAWRGKNVVFTVSILSTLKGPDAPGSVTVHGLMPDRVFAVDPYLLDLTYRHQAGLRNPEMPEFGYTDRFKRSDAKGLMDCDYVPTLDRGMIYLMFLTKPYTAVSFEPIANALHDAWYRHVMSKTRR